MKICLDQGHGKGYNPSPCGYGYTEGTRMYELGVELKKALEVYEDTEVLLTRNSVEEDYSLWDRAWKGRDCDVLISLHSNAVGNSGVNDYTDFVVVFRPVNGSLRELSEKLAQTIAEAMGTKQKPQTKQWWNSAHNADYLGVMRHSIANGVPAILIEHGFHTHTATTKWLMSDKNLKYLAEQEAAAIAETYGLQKKKEEREEVRYYTIADMKKQDRAREHYLPTIQKLLDAGALHGKGGQGDETIIDLGEDVIRITVMNYRAGIYDDFFRKKNM